MKKIIILSVIILLLAGTAYLYYLTTAVLPEKLKAAAIEGLNRATGKSVELSSAKLDILKGLVLKDLSVSDQGVNIIFAKEIRCRFLILPILKRKFILTAIDLDSPELLIQRMPDNWINIIDLFFNKRIALLEWSADLSLSRIKIHKGVIHFQDYTLDPPFEKDIDSAEFDIYLTLPAKAVFKGEFKIISDLSMLIKVSGEYGILRKELRMKSEVKDFYPMEFIRYFNEPKLYIPDGRIDGEIRLEMADNIIDADIDIDGMALKFPEGKINAQLDCGLKAKAGYNLLNKELIYSGDLAVKNLEVSNIDYIGAIHDIRGDIKFSDKDLVSKEITATVFGIPVRARAKIENFAKGVLELDIDSTASLGLLKRILQEKFNINIPAELSGDGALSLALKYKMPIEALPGVRGILVVKDASLVSEYDKTPLEGISGTLEFDSNQLTWSDLLFKRLGQGYRTSGILTNFEKPGIQIDLESENISFKSLLAVNDKVITISSLEGNYSGYILSLQGRIDMTNPAKSNADMSGLLKFDLAEDKEPYLKIKDKFKNAKPSGKITARFNLKGDPKDMASCAIDAEVKSDFLSLYGFKFSGFDLAYSMRSGVMDIKKIHSSLYGATLDANGMIDFKPKDTPYQINGEIKGLKIEALKKDTAFKDTDIAGTIHTRFGLKGFSNDLARLSAWGKIDIASGRLWQLNLFKGLGVLLFKRDFSSVMFREGSCDFFVKDKNILTDDLIMKSDLMDLRGTVRIGFDKTINASLRTEFTNEGIDAGNLGDVSGAIERYSIIEIRGDLKNPKFKIRPDLSNIVSDIADNIFQR